LQQTCGRDKSVAFADNGLNVLGTLGIIPQDLAKLAHRSVNASVCLEEYIFAPELYYDFVAADKIPLPLHKEYEQLHRDLFEFQCPRAPAQLKAAGIEDIVRKLESGWHCGHLIVPNYTA